MQKLSISHLSSSQKSIAIYGTNDCSYTQKALKYFESENITVQYNNLENKILAKQLHEKMHNAGVSTAAYELPVIDINGKLYTRSDLNAIVSDGNQKFTF